MRTPPFLLTLIWIVMATGPAVAEMYHWVDAAGISHYANSPPPPGVEAQSSWAEIHEDAAVDRGLAKENEGAVDGGQTPDAATRQGADSASATGNREIAELEKQRTALAKELLSTRYHFRHQANPLRRRLNDINHEIHTAKAAGNDITALMEEKHRVWDALFTSRYVIHQGYALMVQYQDVTRQINDLLRR